MPLVGSQSFKPLLLHSGIAAKNVECKANFRSTARKHTFYAESAWSGFDIGRFILVPTGTYADERILTLWNASGTFIAVVVPNFASFVIDL